MLIDGAISSAGTRNFDATRGTMTTLVFRSLAASTGTSIDVEGHPRPGDMVDLGDNRVAVIRSVLYQGRRTAIVRTTASWVEKDVKVIDV